MVIHLSTSENNALISEKVKRIYAITAELEALYPGRHFTPDGHMVGSIGEVLVAEKAHQMPFWRYHANEKQPDVAVWSSGLHRYITDEQAAQVLRDIVEIKKGTEDEDLAKEFFQNTTSGRW